MWGLPLCWWRWRGPDRQPQRSSPHVCPQNPGEAEVVISLASRRAAPGEAGLGAKHGRVALHFRKGQALSGPRALSVRLMTPGLGTDAPSLLPCLPPPRRAPVTRRKSRTVTAPKPAPRKAAAARPVRIGQLAEVGRAQDGTAAGDLTCQPAPCFVGSPTGSAFPALMPEGEHGGQAVQLLPSADVGGSEKSLLDTMEPPTERALLKPAHHGCGGPAGCPWA